MMNQDGIEKAVRDLIIALGENPDREGLRETPKRVAKMYAETLEGLNYSNEDIARMFDKEFEVQNNDLVLVKDIECFSYCEHHMALIYDMKISIAYIPQGKVLGISKLARIADMVCKRLQLQERIGADIADILRMTLGVEDIMVSITAKHSCMTARGIRKTDAKTVTNTVRGRFASEPMLRSETLDAMR